MLNNNCYKNAFFAFVTKTENIALRLKVWARPAGRARVLGVNGRAGLELRHKAFQCTAGNTSRNVAL